jgi:HEPN domain-containing protein
MDAREKYAYWEQTAQYDLDTAQAMLDARRYLYVAFMCQQAVEKLVKGLYVLRRGEEPPRTHNISLVYERIWDEDARPGAVIESDVPAFMDRLLYYYISERYTDYKQKAGKSLNGDAAQSLLDKTREVFAWLKSLSA